MSDMSTFAGQAEHYAAVKARLGYVAPKPRMMRLRAPAAPVVTEPVAALDPPKSPAMRDFLFVTLPADPEAPERDILMPAWKVIVHETAKKHGVSFMEIVGMQRSRRIAVARHEACYRIAMETTMSLPMIGRRLGGRDHTTVLHSIRRYAEDNGLSTSRGAREPRRMPIWTKDGWK